MGTDKHLLKSIDSLKKSGLNFRMEKKKNSGDQRFKDTTWCITGSFENYKPRSKAGEIIKKYDGRVTTTVSAKTTHLLAGSSPGSKLTKAEELGIQIITEEQFREMI